MHFDGVRPIHLVFPPCDSEVRTCWMPDRVSEAVARVKIWNESSVEIPSQRQNKQFKLSESDDLRAQG
jgi:hypothetical protein